MSLSGSPAPCAGRSTALTALGCAAAFAVGFGIALMAPAHAAAPTKFDGRPSIEAVTEKGAGMLARAS